MRVLLPVSGRNLTGKSFKVEALLKYFAQRPEVKLAGFIQPSHFEDGDRNGYNLTLVKNDGDLKTMKFARLNLKTKPGQMPFVFEQDAFDAVYDEAAHITCDDRPVILVLDEVGRLEVAGKGHGRSIEMYLERLKGAKKLFVVAVFNERWAEMIMAFFERHGFTTSQLSFTPEETLGERILRTLME